jgi:hypothetical protein
MRQQALQDTLGSADVKARRGHGVLQQCKTQQGPLYGDCSASVRAVGSGPPPRLPPRLRTPAQTPTHWSISLALAANIWSTASKTGRTPYSLSLYARFFSPRTRHRSLGRVASTWPHRPGRSDRTHVPLRRTICRGTPWCRLPSVKRCCAQPGLVSLGRPERTREAIACVQEKDTCWCGDTLWQGHTTCASVCRHGLRSRRMWSAVLRHSVQYYCEIRAVKVVIFRDSAT